MSDSRPLKKPLIRIEDFQSIECSVFLQNATAKVELRDASKIKINEFTDNGIVLLVPRHSSAYGQLLILYIVAGMSNLKLARLPNADTPGILTVTAKVLQVEQVNKENELLTLEFYQFNEKNWNEFLKDFEERQKYLDRIIQQMKE